ncbi:hypothetical protein QFC24_003751 [Naganishia onofrii]|uniref:Uncharacterized protein n=1 Tax=Naganishia onofrii TaxID=1851511 RepID=A0ACC2XKG1_9TREE|nr:hypothetical protein QFC24_003751 [Naganishia onofrii]
MVKKTSATAAPKGAKSPVAKPTPERRSTRATTAATPVPETAEKPTSSASKKRKTSDDFLDEAPKGKEESTKKARASNSKKTAATTTPSKEKDVTIAKPVVTAVTTVDALPLPTTKSAPASGKGKKAVAANKKAAAADPGLVKPSADKPAEGLKSALKKATPAPAPEKNTKKKTSAPAAGKKVKAQEDDAFIHGFSSSEGEDSDDDDESDVDMDGGKGKSATVDVKTLPTIAKDDKSVQRKLTKAKKKQDKERGVLYLGRIPHGFYEDEMKAYFSQFGDITRLRLARNRKTGASKHFAYIEMSSKAVAEITADTMNNYLLMGHILQCHLVPQEKLHPDLWVGANKKWRRVPAARIERSSYGKERSELEQAKVRSKLFKKDQARQQKIKDLGIDYDYTGFTKPDGAEEAPMKA